MAARGEKKERKTGHEVEPVCLGVSPWARFAAQRGPGQEQLEGVH